MRDLAVLQGVLLDIDGTLLRGEDIIEGAVEFLEYLVEENLPFLIVSNNTNSPGYYRELFKKHGIDIDEKKIVTATVTMEEYLSGHKEIFSAYVIGKPDLIKAVERAGVRILKDATEVDIGEVADAVIVGGDFDLSYRKLKDAVLHLQKGARLIGSNPDLLIPMEEGLVPEAGMTIAALEAGSGKKAFILGKPEEYFFRTGIKILGLEEAGQILMVGDRLSTDIEGARRLGLLTALVRTGATEEREDILADLEVENLLELKKLLIRSKENG